MAFHTAPLIRIHIADTKNEGRQVLAAIYLCCNIKNKKKKTLTIWADNIYADDISVVHHTLQFALEMYLFCISQRLAIIYSLEMNHLLARNPRLSLKQILPSFVS